MESLRDAATDPTTEPALLAELAHAHPELRPAIALNPQTYPALLDWLIALDDPAVDDAIARGRLEPEVEHGIDPQLDAASLAELAQHRPELWLEIREHPAAYDGLRDWIDAQLGDPSAPAEAAEVEEPAEAPVPVDEEPAYVSAPVEVGSDSFAAIRDTYVARNNDLVADLASYLNVALDDKSRAQFSDLISGSHALRSLYVERWNNNAASDSLNGLGDELGLDATLNDLSALRTAIRSESQPRYTEARERLREAELEAVNGATNAALDARWTAVAHWYYEWEGRLVDDTTRAKVQRAAADLAAISAAIAATFPQGADGLAPAVPVREMDPVVRFGHLQQDSLVVSRNVPSRANGRPTSSDQRVTLEIPTTRVPFGRRMSQWQSIVTDSKDSIVSFVVQSLAQLPPHQLKVTIFDPEQLGDSVRPLYALHDETSKSVWGDKVHTSASELGLLLTEVEDHITFVTQKYLGRQYDSLHEYNAAAGEVAEPYRLLTLFDFPSGFVNNQGYWNDEMTDRLEKIVRTGTRCGVVTLIHTTPAAVPEIAKQLGGLPVLLDGQASGIEWANDSVQYPGSTAADLLGGNGTIGTAVWSQQLWHAERNPEELGVEDVLRAVSKEVHNYRSVAVTADKVAQLAASSLQRKVREGIATHAVLPVADDPSTWWHHSSADGLTAAFGRKGAAEIAEFSLDSKELSHALLGGRPGSGKSVLLHAIIHDLTARYSPDELELYLLDFKQGVEFKVYATEQLPHARVVAVDAQREFGLSVLLGLEHELQRRGELFRQGDEQVTLAGMRANSGEPLPRVVALIDEFHVLFEQDDAISQRAGAVLELLVRQGRAFGIHCLLASQSLSGVNNIGSHVLKLIPVRIALQSNDADSRLLLSDDNGEAAKVLTRAGEGILNNDQGKKDANQRFQSFFSTPDEQRAHTIALRQKAIEGGHFRAPVVFDGVNSVPIEGYIAELFPGRSTTLEFGFPVGLPLTLGAAQVARLRREAGSNLLIVAPAAEAEATLTSLLAAARQSHIAVDVADFLGEDSAVESIAQQFALTPGSSITVHPRRKFSETLAAYRAEIEARTKPKEEDYRAPTRLLLLSGAHRARSVNADEYADDSDYAQLQFIAANGAEVGVHLVLWTDSWSGLKRRLSNSILTELTLRIVAHLNDDDSNSLLGTSAASALRPFQLIVDDFERSQSTKVRSFASPESVEALITAVTVRD